MKITGLRAYRQIQPLRDGPYGTAAGTTSAFDSLIVALDADNGLTGWGEMAPLGAFYSAAFAAGGRAGIPELAPAVVGTKLTHPRQLWRALNARLQGHPYIKSAIDIAAWDLVAKSAEKPLCDLLGGRYGNAVPLYRPIPHHCPPAETARNYIQEGYRRLQIKVGEDPAEDAQRVHEICANVDPNIVVFTDANGAWTQGQARTFLRLTRDLHITMEQPCASYQECAAIRSACPHPLVLDESIDSLEALLRAAKDGIADGVTFKVSRLGGLTPTILLRDLATELNLPTTIEDTGGGTINAAATIHAGLSTPEHLRIHTCDFQRWVTTDNATGLPNPIDGAIGPGTLGAGIGVQVDIAAIGDPFFSTPSTPSP